MGKTLTFSDAQCLDAALIMFRNTTETTHCSFLFVEGEDDEKFWNGHIAEKCHIVFVTNFVDNNKKKTGKLKVIENIRLLNTSKSNIKSYLGIVDDDFDSLLGVSQENNICATETHDLETLLLSFPSVFKKILAEFGDTQLIADFEYNTQTTVCNYLLELSKSFAEIEYIRHRLKPSLSLKELYKKEHILIEHEWRLDKENLYQFVKNNDLDMTSSEVIELIETLKTINPWLLCNGHIMLDLLAIGFQNGVLNNNPKYTAENISRPMRAAIEKAELYQTQLCQSIFNWQNNNQPYQVLNFNLAT